MSLAALLVTRLLPRAGSPRHRAVIRTTITPPEGTEIVGRGLAIGIALSPDGGKLAFVGSSASTTGLFVRRMDILLAEPLPGTARARYPFWSPDGTEIGFFADRKLKVVHVAGGSTRVVCETGQFPTGGAWAPDGTIYFGSEGGIGPIFKVTSAGAKPEPITRLDASRGEKSHESPSLLPGGHHLLFATSNALVFRGVRILSLDDGSVGDLLPGALVAAVSDGHVAFIEGDTLYAQKLDTGTLRPTGERVILGRGLTGMLLGSAVFSLGGAGALAYLLPAVPPIQQPGVVRRVRSVSEQRGIEHLLSQSHDLTRRRQDCGRHSGPRGSGRSSRGPPARPPRRNRIPVDRRRAVGQRSRLEPERNPACPDLL